jgi:tetratricopeptide (TPR) repeat protein
MRRNIISLALCALLVLVASLPVLASQQPTRKSAPRAPQKKRPAVKTPAPGETAASVDTDVKASRVQIEAGNRLAGEKRWAEAAEAYKLAAFADPGNAEIQDMLGDAYMNAGRYKEAFAAYREAVRLAPKDAEAHYKLGAAYTVMGQYGDAFQPFLQALRFDPQHAEAHYGIGHAYVYLEEYQKALGFLRSAVRLAPDLAEAHYDLALVYDALDDANAFQKEQTILQKLDPALANELSRALR